MALISWSLATHYMQPNELSGLHQFGRVGNATLVLITVFYTSAQRYYHRALERLRGDG